VNFHFIYAPYAHSQEELYNLVQNSDLPYITLWEMESLHSLWSKMDLNQEWQVVKDAIDSKQVELANLAMGVFSNTCSYGELFIR
jgi:hypothetical protein